MKKLLLVLSIFSLIFPCVTAYPQTEYTIFDDKALLNGYAEKYANQTKDILLEMIKDDALASYKCAAAIHVFKERFSKEIFSPEKNLVEKILLHRLAKTSSNFVEIEIMHTLCTIDRYKYFDAMVPALIQLIDHYNETVSELAYSSTKDIIDSGYNRSREARIVFNVLRRMLFLSRKKLQDVKEPSLKLKRKLDLLRWSIKILGTQELKKLPAEVINLL
ncbi:MAG TPA: hypothetical protein PL155_08035 [Candidatus Omnitrophota bacterium]|nr:hypothetical protein [Candidatus Omnitrophota bacterium]HPD85220.1 hypothetical protein [Candidatus Omnitrophota bacterium]HRZ04279.1 hypothetical protein [Candidatus Omnitrophota bacterium]